MYTYLRKTSVIFCPHSPRFDEQKDDKGNFGVDLSDPIIKKQNVPDITQLRV